MEKEAITCIFLLNCYGGNKQNKEHAGGYEAPFEYLGVHFTPYIRMHVAGIASVQKLMWNP